MPFSSARAKTILLVDKEDTYATSLRGYLPQESTVVVLSKKHITTDLPTISIPFSSFPQIPDSLYDAIVFFYKEEDAHLLEPLAKKADIDHVPFYIVFSYIEAGEKSLQKIPYPGIQVVLGDVFGQAVDTPLAIFLQEAKKRRKVQLADMGLTHWYPIAYKDAIQKIANLIDEETKKRKLFIGPQHPMTELSIAHTLQKIDPFLTIDFSNESKKIVNKDVGESAFDTYDSQKAIQTYYEKLPQVLSREEEKNQSVFFTQQGKKKKKPSWLLYGVYVLCACIFIPLLAVVLTGGVGVLLLKSSIDDLSSGNISQAVQKATASQQYLMLADLASGVLEKEGSLVGLSAPLMSVEHMTHVGLTASQLTQSCLITFQDLSNVLSGKTTTAQDDVNAAIGQIKTLASVLGQISPNDIPMQFRSSFAQISRLVFLSDGLIDSLPTILGTTGSRTYLILLQNNMELRPGGGFIGSYALVHLSRGRIQDFSVHNVYDADGQLKGHVEPPFAIRRYIPLVHLYLRDSNFDPDFSVNAQKAAFLLSAETGEKVDGVMAIDLNVLQAVLSTVGNVYVPSYNQTVTKDNFFSLIESHAEKNSFPGSTQKQDFLNSFTQALFLKLQHPTHLSLTTLLRQVVSLIDRKDVMVSFQDPITQSAVALSGIGNTLEDERASVSGTLNDFLGVVEANIGVNKVNAFVTRSLSQHMSVDASGNVQETATLTLTNNSDGSWPGGGYKNYLRFIVPIGSKVQKILINNVEQSLTPAITNPSIYEAKNFVAPKGLEVATEEEQGKALYGFLVIVPVKSTMTITVIYTLDEQLSLQNLNPQYNLQVWKQPGVDPYPYTLHVSLPDGEKLLQSNVALSEDNTYQTTIGQDTNILLSLTTK